MASDLLKTAVKEVKVLIRGGETLVVYIVLLLYDCCTYGTLFFRKYRREDFAVRVIRYGVDRASYFMATIVTGLTSSTTYSEYI